jgi:hypothetical protein
VLVSWLKHAGPDGIFEDLDIETFGETLAHEVGHFLGLYHPVGQYFDQWDALEDTPQCTNRATCEAELGANVMFPYVVCAGDAACIRQEDLTEDQVGVLVRYAGVQ